MKLKEQILADFVSAMKAKDERRKSALGMLKAKITEGEKANKNQELSDSEIMKAILSSIKQRKQSIEEFSKGGRADLVEKETVELEALVTYLPKQMDRSEVEEAIKKILSKIPASSNKAKMSGMAMGAFNNQYQGRADTSIVKEIIGQLV